MVDTLEAELTGHTILRMDADTTRSRGSHTAILKAFQEEAAQVLVGTQMVAKGLDFPKVTLVGIIHVDGLLSLPDYQGAERAFQMVTQAAGRAGRGERLGRVLIQTFDPGNPLFQSIIDYDYNSFYQREMQFRQMMNYPPWVYLARIVISSVDEKTGMNLALQLTDFINEIKIKEVTVLGPATAPIFRIKDRLRYHILLRGKDDKGITNILNRIRRQWNQGDSEARILLDMDPQSLM